MAVGLAIESSDGFLLQAGAAVTDGPCLVRSLSLQFPQRWYTQVAVLPGGRRLGAGWRTLGALPRNEGYSR